jgi:16S rRNA (adenine1518-N6/adenine1519-N6)-dimethyltransferase
MVQYHAQVELGFVVSRDAFDPPPQVLSRMVKMIPYTHCPHQARDEILFAEIVKTAFNQRRKTLRNSLKHMIPLDAWLALSISSDARPEQLTVADFVALSNYNPG